MTSRAYERLGSNYVTTVRDERGAIFCLSPVIPSPDLR